MRTLEKNRYVFDLQNTDPTLYTTKETFVNFMVDLIKSDPSYIEIIEDFSKHIKRETSQTKYHGRENVVFKWKENVDVSNFNSSPSFLTCLRNCISIKEFEEINVFQKKFLGNIIGDCKLLRDPSITVLTTDYYAPLHPVMQVDNEIFNKAFWHPLSIDFFDTKISAKKRARLILYTLLIQHHLISDNKLINEDLAETREKIEEFWLLFMNSKHIWMNRASLHGVKIFKNYDFITSKFFDWERIGDEIVGDWNERYKMISHGNLGEKWEGTLDPEEQKKMILRIYKQTLRVHKSFFYQEDETTYNINNVRLY